MSSNQQTGKPASSLSSSSSRRATADEETPQATRCDCGWSDLAPEAPCGCGTHAVRLYRDVVWHYTAAHWDAACLIQHLGSALAASEARRAALERKSLVDDVAFASANEGFVDWKLRAEAAERQLAEAETHVELLARAAKELEDDREYNAELVAERDVRLRALESQLATSEAGREQLIDAVRDLVGVANAAVQMVARDPMSELQRIAEMAEAICGNRQPHRDEDDHPTRVDSQ